MGDACRAHLGAASEARPLGSALLSTDPRNTSHCQ